MWTAGVVVVLGIRGDGSGDYVLDLSELRALVEKPASAGLDTGPAVLRIGMVGENDELDRRRFGVHRAQHVDAGSTEQLKVEHDPVGPRAEDAADCVSRSLRLADDLDALDFGQQLGQAVPDRREIFDEEYFGAGLRFHDRQYRQSRMRGPSVAAESDGRRGPNSGVGGLGFWG